MAELDDTLTASGHPIAALVRALDEALDAAAEAPDWSLDGAQTSGLLEALASRAGRLAEVEARLVGHAETLDLPGQLQTRSTGAWLARLTHRTATQAHRVVRLAHALGAHPQTREALARGELHADQALAVTDAVDELDDEASGASTDDRERAERHLLALAAHHDAQALRVLGRRILEVVDPGRADQHEARLLEREEARAAARTRFTMSDDGEGTSHGRFVIPTAQASMLRAMLHALAAPKHVRATQGAGSYDHAKPTPKRLGEAFVELIETVRADDLPTRGGVSATVVATVDVSVLTGAAKAAQLDTGVRISPGQLRRWACEAGVLPAVIDGPSRVLDLGRKQRYATAAQRTALAVTQRTCRHDGCDVPASFCHAHHTDGWAAGGRTDLALLELLCPFHHHLEHARQARSRPMRT